MRWGTVKLGDACDVVAGGTPKRSEPRYWDGDIPWVKISDMLQGSITQTDESITEAGLEGSAAKLLPPGTLLVSIFATIGRTAVLACEAATNQAIVGVIPKERDQFDDRFLEYSLQEKAAGLERKARGVAQANINGSVLKATELPLPPLAEQKRIAGILDAADALRAKRRESLARLDTLLQSTFLDMFGDPVTNPMGWEGGMIGDIAEVKGGKRLPKGEEYSEIPTDYRYIRVSDLRPNGIYIQSLKYLKAETQARIARYIVDPGDVIISIAGTIGITAAVPEDLGGANLTENAAKIAFRDRGAVDAVYVSYALQMPHAQFQIAGHTGQVTIGKLALFRIQKITIPLPPIDLQQRFAAIVESVEQQKASQRAHLAELDTLFASLQSRAFRGDL